MKYLIIIMVSCFSWYSCTKTPPKREVTIEQQEERMRLDSLYLLYDSMPPRFDIKDFNKKRKDKDSYGFYEGDSLYIEYRLSKPGFIVKKESFREPLIEYSHYDSLGIIQKNYKIYHKGWSEGDYFLYNKNGKLINVTWDKSHFSFTEKDLRNFADSMGVERYRIPFTLLYDTITNRHYWFLHDHVKGRLERIFHLDAQTGELLNYIEYNPFDTKYRIWRYKNIIIDDEKYFF